MLPWLVANVYLRMLAPCQQLFRFRRHTLFRDWLERVHLHTGNATHPILSIGYFLLGKVRKTIPIHRIINFTPFISGCCAIFQGMELGLHF